MLHMLPTSDVTAWAETYGWVSYGHRGYSMGLTIGGVLFFTVGFVLLFALNSENLLKKSNIPPLPPFNRNYFHIAAAK